LAAGTQCKRASGRKRRARRQAGIGTKQKLQASQNRPPTSLYQSRMSLESARKNLEITKQDVVLGTDQLYYSLLRAEHLVSISGQALDLSERQFEIALAKESVGMATKLDIMRAENQTASARNSLASALLSKDLATVSLNQAIGFAPETILSLRDEFFYEKTEDLGLDASIEFALAKRVEISQAQSAVEIADIECETGGQQFYAETYI